MEGEISSKKQKTVIDESLPPHVNFWLSESTKNDCFFIVGPPENCERIGSFRLFLSGYSEPFRAMLWSGGLCEKGDIALPDVSPSTFKIFLKCIYGGSEIVNLLSLEEASNLLSIVEKYMVAMLKPFVAKHIGNLLSVANIFVALMNPVCFLEEHLEKVMSYWVQQETDKVLNDERFLSIDGQCLLWIVKQHPLNTSEVHIWDAVLRWAKHTLQTDDKEEWKKHISHHIKCIYFEDMSKEDFFDKVLPVNLLEVTETVRIMKSFVKYNFMSCFSVGSQLHGTFSHKINIADPMPSTSPYFVLSDFSLKLCVEKCIGPLPHAVESISVLLCGNKIKNVRRQAWECDMTIDLTFVNYDGRNLTKSFQCPFSNVTNEMLCIICSWSKISNPKRGFLKNGTVDLVVNISL